LVLKAATASPLLTVQTTGTDPSSGGWPTGMIALSHLRLTSAGGKLDTQGQSVAHALSIVSGTWLPWVVLDDVTATNMPADGVNEQGNAAVLWGLNSKFVNNGRDGALCSGADDWRFWNTEFSENTLDNLSLYSCGPVEIEQTNNYSAGRYGLYVTGTTEAFVNNFSFDRNQQGGIYIDSSTRPAGQGILYLTQGYIGLNGSKAANTYPDIMAYGGTGRIVMSQVEMDAPYPDDGSEYSNYNIEFANSSAVAFSLSNVSFRAGNLFSPYVSNVPAQIAAVNSDSAGVVSIGGAGASITSKTQFTGLHLSNGTNTVAVLQGNGAGNDGGVMALSNGGTTQVMLSALGNSYIYGGLSLAGSLNLTSDGKAQIAWDSTNNEFVFLYNGVRLAHLDTSGNLVIKGALTQSGAP